MANDSLKEYVDKTIEDEGIEKDIQSFLHLITDNTLNDKHLRDTKNEMIRMLFNEGFEIHDPSGTKKIGSKVIQQALWRVMSKVKFLDFGIYGTGKDEDVERLVTEGIRTVSDRGNLASCFRDKAGIFMNAFMYGDGFLFFGKGENDENPVAFRVLRNEDVYVDIFAYGTRGVKPANRMAVIFQFDKEEAYELWPELEENNVWGRIPGSHHSSSTRLADRQDRDVLEVCWAWNKQSKKYIIFAGTTCFEIDRFEDEEYPFMLNNKAYIPVFQFMCMPSADGFWNYGVGDMVYDLAIITRKLLNMEVTHLEENTLPVTLINAPQNKVDELVEKMAMATEARKEGGKPFVAMEFDPNGGQSSVAAQALVTQNLFNEWTAIWDRLYKELSRLGIDLDDVDRGDNTTRGQVIAEEQASNAFILQMMEYNATETQFLIECVMDAITEFVSTKNKTPLNLMTRITYSDGTTAKLKTMTTMGMLSAELKDGNYFVITDSRTGAIPSDLMKMIKIEQQLQITQPGTPEFAELYRQLAVDRGVKLPSQSGSAPAPTPQPGPAAASGGATPLGAQPAPAGALTPPAGMPPGQASQTQRVLPAPSGNVMNQPV